MNKNRLHYNSQVGMSLVEVMVTLLILSVGFLALMKLQAYIISSNDLANQRIVATEYAQEKIEQLRDFNRLSHDESSAANNEVAYSDIQSGSSTVINGNTNYQRVWQVAENTTDNYKTIDVNVTWSDRYGDSHNVALSTLIAESDPATSGYVY